MIKKLTMILILIWLVMQYMKLQKMVKLKELHGIMIIVICHTVHIKFFIRGGRYSDGEKSGIFYFDGVFGNNSENYGFRPVLNIVD